MAPLSRALPSWLPSLLALLLHTVTPGGEGGRAVVFLGDASYPPMTYLDGNVAKGVAIDILHALEQRTGRRFDIRLMPWNEAQAALLRGEADALCQMSITEARQKLYDFTDPVLESQYSIFTHAGRPGLVRLADLHGLQVAVTTGGLPRQLLEQEGGIGIVPMPDYPAGFAMLHDGTVDAILADRWVGAYILAEHRIRDVRISSEPIATLASAIAVAKGHAELLAVLNAGIASLRTDGTITRITQEWQPKDVVFMTREHIERWVYRIAFGLLALVLVAVAAWAVSLRREISVRRRTEAALRASEARIRAIFDLAPIGIAIIDVGSHRLTQVNPAFCAIVGRDRNDLLTGELGRLSHPDDLAATATAAKNLNTGAVERIALRKRYLRPDGTVVWTEMIAVSEGEPGQPAARTIALVRDITLLHQAEEERRRNAEQIATLHERLALATRSAHIGIWDWDIPRNSLVWDDEMYRLYGVDPATFTAAVETWPRTLHPDDRERAMAEVQATLRGESGFETEFRTVWPDGSVHSLRAAAQVFFAADGQPLRMVGVNYDVTERRRAEDALRRHHEDLERLVSARTSDLELARAAAERLSDSAAAANRAKSDFLASMSHEIRTPLNAVLGYAQLLARDRELTAGHRRAIETINRSGEHLLSLISDILEMSRIEAGRSSVDAGNVDLHELLDNLKSLFLQRAKEKGLELRLALEADLPRCIRTDQRKLHQMLANLLSNAVKFTAAGRIDMRATYAAGELRIVVQDTGPGISKEAQARLFQPFVQVGSGRGKGEGSGLGLAISRGFAQMLGGGLTLESEAGCGATFTLRIPAAVAAYSGGSSTSRREVVGLVPGLRPQRILIAEDHLDNQRLLHDLLTSMGLEVRAVGDGAAALTACRDWQPDLIWMDIDMPIMDGLAATRAIRELPGRPPVIVALTAAAFQEDRARILASGCDEVVRKPYREEELFTLMESRLDVRFVWRDAPRQQADTPVDNDHDLVARFAALPADDRRRLQEVVVMGDVANIISLTNGWQDRTLAAHVAALAENLAMERLASLVTPPQGDGL